MPRPRLVSSGSLFLAALALSAQCAGALSLSGTVLNFDSTGRSGVTVSLRLADTTLSTVTREDGAWALGEATLSIASRKQAPKATGHLSFREGRLQLSFGEHDISGRRISNALPAIPSRNARLGRTSSALLGSGMDTLVYSWNGQAILRDTLHSLEQTGIVRTFDTTVNPAVTYDYVKDKQGHTYRYIWLGNRAWMAENYRYVTDSSWCPAKADSCGRLGRVYTWADAMNVPKGFNTIPLGNTAGRPGICPDGWKLPDTLAILALKRQVKDSAAKRLRSRFGWPTGYTISVKIAGIDTVNAVYLYDTVKTPYDNNGTDQYGFHNAQTWFLIGKGFGSAPWLYSTTNPRYWGSGNSASGGQVLEDNIDPRVGWSKSTPNPVRCIREDSSRLEKIVISGMRWIEGGSFLMGCDSTPTLCPEDERPVHKVTVSGFWMDTLEFGYQAAQNLRSIFEPNSLLPQGKAGWFLMGFDSLTNPKRDSLPNDYLGWLEAAKLCNARSKLEGYDTVYSNFLPPLPNDSAGSAGGSANADFTKNGYRLPTEAEWEYAARAGTSTLYPWGGDSLQASQYACFGARTCRRGSKLPNAWGLYDMIGNAWEWTNDWYGAYSSEEQTNPIGPAASGTDTTFLKYRKGTSGSGVSKGHVSRGHSIYADAKSLRPAYRGGFWGLTTGNGFRMVRRP